MSNPFLSEIRMFAGNFAPRGWATCSGQLLAISSNTALFSLLGTFYGGNGTSNFALPDLRGRFPMHQGQGPGLTDRVIGEQGGEESVTLSTAEMAAHTHPISGAVIANSIPTATPSNTSLFTNSAPNALYAITPVNVSLAPQSISLQGGSQPHNNLQPYLSVTFIIALQGVFPARN
jgi:microcystin-dependent protein